MALDIVFEGFFCLICTWNFLSGNCAENEYTCVADQKCILKTWLCDGEPDCAGGDDEAGCGLQTGEAACTCTRVCRGENVM